MGFKIIKENDKKVVKEFEKERLDQLLKEARRWANLTASSERHEEILRRIREISSTLDERYQPDKVADEIGFQLRHGGINLVNTQGNIELGKLTDLL